MFHSFSGQTADAVWLQAAQALSSAGAGAEPTTAIQASRTGATREILHACLSIADPRQRWVVSRTPPINPAYAIAEVIWILSGRNDSRLPNYFNNELPNFAGHGQTYHGAYGHRLRRHFGLDQLERAYQALLHQPDSRQVILQIWDLRADLPAADGQPVAQDIPCNVLSMLKVRSGALEWAQVLRSNDLFRGIPYNFVQFTVLQEVLAGWLGIGVGSYNQLSDSLHVYERDASQVAAVTPVAAPASTDSLALRKGEFDRVLAELASQADRIASEEVTAESLHAMVEHTSLPRAYRNLLAVLCAEGARRRRRLDVVQPIMSNCDNTCLVALFDRWMKRVASRPAMQEVSKPARQPGEGCPGD